MRRVSPLSVTPHARAVFPSQTRAHDACGGLGTVAACVAQAGAASAAAVSLSVVPIHLPFDSSGTIANSSALVL
jgi:predicted methyltransferase